MDVKKDNESSEPQSQEPPKQGSLEAGLGPVLIGLGRLLILLEGLIEQNAHLIHQNQQILDLMMQMDPEAEPTTYLDGTRRQ